MNVLEGLRGGLVVSCPAVGKGPMDHPEIIADMAAADVAEGRMERVLSGSRT